MKDKKFSNKNVLDLLIKKASGFYYSEEQYEYEKTQNKSKFHENNCILTNNLQNFDTHEQQLTFFNDTIKTGNDPKKRNKDTENLTLVKKKITTHYVSPDMLAIKILLEIYGKEVTQIESLSDEDLINLKNKLIGEIINEEN